MDLGTIFAFDKETQAIVGWAEIYEPLEVVRGRMRRPPDVEREDLVAWGKLSDEELHAVIMVEDLEDKETYDELLALRATTAFVSLHFEV